MKYRRVIILAILNCMLNFQISSVVFAYDKSEDVQKEISEYNSTKNTSHLDTAAKYLDDGYKEVKYDSELQEIKDETEIIKLFGGGPKADRKKIEWDELREKSRDMKYSNICMNYIKIARLYTEANLLKDAMGIYRNVIRFFSKSTKDNELRICLQDADFGLEDVRSIEAKNDRDNVAKEKIEKEKAEQSKTDIDKIQKENIDLKKEIKRLKKENESLRSKLQINK